MRDSSYAGAADFLRRAPGCEDAPALEEAFAHVLAELGVKAFSCARQDGSRPGGPPIVMAQRGLEAWDRHMAERGYFSINPCVRWTALGRHSFTWREVQAETRRTGQASERIQELWADAAEHGLRDGLVVRTVSAAGHVLSTRMITGAASIRAADRTLLESVASTFATLLHRFHEEAAGVRSDPALTSREAACLRWAAQGLHDREISLQLGISGNTVRSHMRNAMQKLGAPSRLSAYYRALSLGALE